jgi:hypothetical protein
MTKNAQCGDKGKILFSHPNLIWNEEKLTMSNLCHPTFGPFVCFHFGAFLQMTTITIAHPSCALQWVKAQEEWPQ